MKFGADFEQKKGILSDAQGDSKLNIKVPD